MQHYTPPRNSPPRHVTRPSPALGRSLDSIFPRYTTRQHGTDWDVYRDDLAGGDRPATMDDDVALGVEDRC